MGLAELLDDRLSDSARRLVPHLGVIVILKSVADAVRVEKQQVFFQNLELLQLGTSDLGSDGPGPGLQASLPAPHDASHCVANPDITQRSCLEVKDCQPGRCARCAAELIVQILHHGDQVSAP